MPYVLWLFYPENSRWTPCHFVLFNVGVGKFGKKSDDPSFVNSDVNHIPPSGIAHIIFTLVSGDWQGAISKSDIIIQVIFFSFVVLNRKMCLKWVNYSHLCQKFWRSPCHLTLFHYLSASGFWTPAHSVTFYTNKGKTALSLPLY